MEDKTKGFSTGDLQKRHQEISALLEGSRSILKYREFHDSARAIFGSCKKLIGAASWYIALLTEDGKDNEVLFLDSGGLSCTVDEELPMPIRGLAGEAYRLKKAVYDNEVIRQSFVLALEDTDYEVDTAESGEKGVEKERSKKYDLFFTEKQFARGVKMRRFLQTKPFVGMVFLQKAKDL